LAMRPIQNIGSFLCVRRRRQEDLSRGDPERKNQGNLFHKRPFSCVDTARNSIASWGGFSSNIFSFFTAVFHTPRAQGETAVKNWVAGRRGRYYDEFRIVFRPGDAQVNELNREDRFCGRSILRAS